MYRSQGSWVNIRHQRRQDNYTRTGCFFLSLRNTNIAFHARNGNVNRYLIRLCTEKKKKKERNYSANNSLEWSNDQRSGSIIIMDFVFWIEEIRGTFSRAKSMLLLANKIKIFDRSKRHFSFLWYIEWERKLISQTRRDNFEIADSWPAGYLFDDSIQNRSDQ